MSTVQELKKALKKAQAEINEKKKIENLAKTINPEDVRLLESSEDSWNRGYSETVRFTLEIEIDVSARPDNDYDKASLEHAEMRLISSDGIPKVLAKELVSSLEYMQHDDADFSWAKGFPLSKTVVKEAQKKVDNHTRLMEIVAKKYNTDASTLNEALYQIRNSKSKR